jgi:uncharacterized protein YllA (UPF0747 family)
MSEFLLSEFVIEKLFETRDSYLNILKQVSFQLMMEPTDAEIKQFKEIEKNTLDNLEKIQQEISQILSKNPDFLQ